MKITLEREGRESMNAEVNDRNWVSASRDAAWAYLNYVGGSSVTAVSKNGHRIVTVSLEYHDE